VGGVGFFKHTTSLVVFRNIKFWGRQGYTSSNGGIGVHPLIFSSYVVTHAIMKRYITSLPPQNLAESPDRDPRTAEGSDVPIFAPCRSNGRSRTARWTLIDETHVGLMQVHMYKRARARLVRSGGGGAVSIGGKNRGGGDPDGLLFPE
jgi:hypothetical protein